MSDRVESIFLTVPINGGTCRIHVRMQGAGPITLLIHGWLHSSEIWSETEKILCPLSRIISVDLPGFGMSPPLPEGAVSLESYAALLLNLIHNINKDEAVDSIVADSLGAVLVLKVLSQTRLPVRLLLLSGYPADGLPRPLCVFANRGMIAWILERLKKLPAPLSKTIIKLLSIGTVRRLRNVSPIIIRAALQADPRTAEKLFSDLCTYRHKDESFSNRQIGSSIILRGQKDRIVSECTARRSALRIDATYVEVPEVGHTPMVEFPSAYCASLVRALKE